MATYPRRMGPDWWRKRPAYTLVMARELTAVFIALYLIEFVVLIGKVGAGPEAYAAHLEFLASPPLLLFHALALGSALLHTVTWFNLAPRALVVRIGEDKLPAIAISGPHYIGWIVFSIGVLWLVLA